MFTFVGQKFYQIKINKKEISSDKVITGENRKYFIN